MESIKKNQSETKDTSIKIKNNLQGINSRVDEAKNHINEEEKAFNLNSKKKRESKKTRIG